MAITFIQEKKRQRYLILILALVIFFILLVVWWGFFRVEEFRQPEVPVFVPKKIEIDWQALKSPQLKELETFEKIGEFEEEIGRENPFILY